jgi:hypothetical protein
MLSLSGYGQHLAQRCCGTDANTLFAISYPNDSQEGIHTREASHKMCQRQNSEALVQEVGIMVSVQTLQLFDAVKQSSKSTCASSCMSVAK